LVIGVGAFARDAAARALAGSGIRIGGMLHPSPASPRANRGWADAAESDLAACGIRV
jgi:single-strand selective monofunctional uracil DNA glycosylase